MAKIKKYWIRYNAGADRLEEEVTEARFRPKGSGWKEIEVDKCCDIPVVPIVSGERTISFTYSVPDIIEYRVHLTGEQGQGYFTTALITSANTNETLTVPDYGTYTVILEVVTGSVGYTITLSNSGIAGFQSAAAPASYIAYNRDLTTTDVTEMNSITPSA